MKSGCVHVVEVDTTCVGAMAAYFFLGGTLTSSVKFFDLMEAHQSPVATEAVERIALLYAIEKEVGSTITVTSTSLPSI
jgi:hypothetical protein